MNRTVKYQGAFSRIVGFAGKRSPLPLPVQPFFCFLSNFRAITRLETLATQAICKLTVDKNNAKKQALSIGPCKYDFDLTLNGSGVTKLPSIRILGVELHSMLLSL